MFHARDHKSFFLGWVFYKINPWKPIFNKFLRKLLEADLVKHYKDKTYFKAKQRFLESDVEKMEFKEIPLVNPLSLDDLQGLFYLSGCLLVLAFISFLIELIIFGQTRKSKVAPF